MDINFYEKLIGYYKCRIEDDEKYNKRIESEERDAYRVIKAINNSKHQISIKNMGDLARLLNVAKQLTLGGSRNIFKEFSSIPQVESVVRNMKSKKPEQIQAIQNYDFSDWEPDETRLEQEHRQVENFRKANTDEMYRGVLSKASNIITSGKFIQIKTSAKSEKELSERHKSILALSKIVMRLNGLLPSSQLQFEEGNVVLSYTEAKKEFGDTSRCLEQTMSMSPAQVEEEEKKKEEQKAKRWVTLAEEKEKIKREKQSIEDKWSRNQNRKREDSHIKREERQDRGISR